MVSSSRTRNISGAAINPAAALFAAALSSSSPSPSPSSSSSNSSLLSSLHSQVRSSSAMEEAAVWDDIINPSPIPDGHRHSRPRPSAMIFQDFLGQPFPRDVVPPPKANDGFVPPSLSVDYGGGGSCSSSSASSSLTALSLNSGLEFQLTNVSPSFSASPFEALASSVSPILPCFGSKKRLPESENASSGDRRHKRMIKNRESAARSRARKQAYTNELELEVAQLTEENARLRKQQEQYNMASSGAPLPKKYSLHRCSTAPF